MNLYLLSQTLLNGFDTYNSCVVAAVNEDDAKIISPTNDGKNELKFTSRNDKWPGLDRLDSITVKLLGEAVTGTESGVICSSFNAA